MKVWWGLAASALSLLIILLAYSAMVAGLPTVDRLSADEAAPGIEVPVIGTVGDFPDPKRRHVVNVTAEGRIVVEGRSRTLDETKAILKVWGDQSLVWMDFSGRRMAHEPPPNVQAIRISMDHVLLRADGQVPWDTLARLLLHARDAKFFNIWFAVRHEGDGEEGALAFPMTDERGSPSALLREGGSMFRSSNVGIDIVPSPQDGSPQALYAALRTARLDDRGRNDGWLHLDRRLRTRDVLELWDAALRARGMHVGLDWEGPPAVTGEPATPGGYSFCFVGWEPTKLGTIDPMPPVMRVHGSVRALDPYLQAPDWPDPMPPKPSRPK